MEFYNDTILGQVIKQVHDNKHNDLYFEQIDDLIEEIVDQEFLNYDVQPWQKQNLFIANLIPERIKERSNEWLSVETEYVNEYSWLVERLVEIYCPDVVTIKRLLITVGYLLNAYGEKFDDITEILRVVTSSSIIFLHPDHLGKDRFKVQPIKLPKFGPDF